MACVLVGAAIPLGLVATPSARASCAGPQVVLEQGGGPVVARRVGQGETEKLLYDIAQDRPLRVLGSNLTFECQDTESTTRTACGAPSPNTVDPIKPMQDVELILSQYGRRWTLARVGAIGPDLTARLEVKLPRGVRPGPALLSMLDGQEGSGAQLDLILS